MQYQIDAVVAGRNFGNDTVAVLACLAAHLGKAGFDPLVVDRGHIGRVLRFAMNGASYFDALPSQNRVRFYFSVHASRVPGLSWGCVSKEFSEAEIRPRDGIFSIPLYSVGRAELVSKLVVKRIVG
jgi:hypothetical protein